MVDGRFAPSPTGPLHFGSLIAATASYLCADRWSVRIEDLDPPREMPGAATDILATLERFGFEWHGEVCYQSRHHDRYQAALEQLRSTGHAYPCACSRREIADHGLPGLEGHVYPGTCRRGLPRGKPGRAWRVRTGTAPVAFTDATFGHVAQNLEALTGDFVVRRADGFWAYQLAVVVDDARDGIAEVVRGADLLDSTTRQVHLQRLLGLPTPRYRHLPVALDADGAKLSKRTGALPLERGHEVRALSRALAFLGQRPPADLADGGLADVWTWSRANWAPQCIPRERALPAVPASASSR